MRRWAYWVWAVGSAALFAAAAAQAVRTFADPRSHPEMYFNADFLTPAALYDDLVLDGYPLRGFQFSAANFVFPDVLTYFAVRAAAGATAPAFLLWMAALFGVVAAGGATAAVALTPGPARRYVGPAVLCVLAAYLGANAGQFFGGFARELILPVSHTGALACALFGVAACAGCLRSPRRGRRLGWAAGLFALTAVTTFSDRLFGLYFTGPVVVALIAARLGSRPDPGGAFPVTWPRILLTTAALAAGTVAAQAGLRAAQGADDPLRGYWTGVTWEGAGERLQKLFGMLSADAAAGNVLVLSAAAWYARSAARGAAWAARRAVGRPAGPSGPLAFYELFTAAMAVAVVAAFVLSRASVYLFEAAIWPDFSRYFIGPFGAALFGWPLAAAAAAAEGGPVRRALGLGVPLLVAAGCVALSAGPRSPDVDLGDVYPDEVRQLDEVCRRRGLRDGLGGYWPAKRVTLLSRAGVLVRQVVVVTPGGRPQLAPHVWLSNVAWYWQPPARDPGGVRPTFVLTVDAPDHPLELRTPDVVMALGEPAARDRAGKYTVLVYDRASDVRLHRFHEWDATLACRRYELRPEPPVRLAAAGMPATTGHAGPSGEREAVEGRDAAGLVAFGPYWRPPAAGRYAAAFRVTSSGSAGPNGAAVILLTDSVEKTTRTVAVQPVAPGTDGEVRVEFDLPRLPPRLGLETQLLYTGSGRLVLHAVELVPPR